MKYVFNEDGLTTAGVPAWGVALPPSKPKYIKRSHLQKIKTEGDIEPDEIGEIAEKAGEDITISTDDDEEENIKVSKEGKIKLGENKENKMKRDFPTNHYISVVSDGIKVFLSSNVFHGKRATQLMEDRKKKKEKVLTEDKSEKTKTKKPTKKREAKKSDRDLIAEMLDEEGFEFEPVEESPIDDEISDADLGGGPDESGEDIGDSPQEEDTIEVSAGDDKLEIIKEIAEPLFSKVAEIVGKKAGDIKAEIDDEEASIYITIPGVGFDDLMKIVDETKSLLSSISVEVVGEEPEVGEIEAEIEETEEIEEITEPSEEEITEGKKEDDKTKGNDAKTKEKGDDEKPDDEDEKLDEKLDEKPDEEDESKIKISFDQDENLIEGVTVCWDESLVSLLTESFLRSYVKKAKKELEEK